MTTRMRRGPRVPAECWRKGCWWEGGRWQERVREGRGSVRKPRGAWAEGGERKAAARRVSWWETERDEGMSKKGHKQNSRLVVFFLVEATSSISY